MRGVAVALVAGSLAVVGCAAARADEARRRPTGDPSLDREVAADYLRVGIRARKRRNPDLSDYVVKPREVFVLPVVALSVYVDPASVQVER